MPEESTFRKYACPKLKLSRLLLDNLFRILVQNLPALEELNSRKHTPSPIVWFLRNCGISQKGQFCAKWFVRMIAQRKKNFAFRSAKIAQQFCEWKPYSESILKGSFAIISRDPHFVTSHKLLVPKYQGSLLRCVTLDGL